MPEDFILFFGGSLLLPRRIRMIIQYDGVAFHGFQAQAQGPTVQQTLEEAIFRLTGCAVRVNAAGRTDTGVHAMALPVHFDLEHPVPADRLPFALHKFLPPWLSVLEAAEVPGFDSRHHAILRWYRYQLHLNPIHQPLGARGWYVHHRVDPEAIAEGLALLRGDHDFTGFRSSHCQAKRTLLTMREASMTQAGDILALDFKCRSFLHHMVRFMTGTLVAMGQGKLGPERLLRIRDAGERPQLIYCAPPDGLCLMGVAYTLEERDRLLASHPPPPSF